MNRWECMTCSYIYSEGLEGVLRYIPRRLSFEALDIEWICPECGISKKGIKDEYNKRTA